MRIVDVTAPGGEENLVLAEADTPAPGPGELVIAVVAAGVNRADLLQRQGFYPPPKGSSEVLGLEVSGRVHAVGEGVEGWTAGAPCVALLTGGGYAEYVVVPAGQVIPPPPGVDLVSAAGLIEVAATVASNFDHVHLAAGETVLIHGGAGGIGTFAIQYARALGPASWPPRAARPSSSCAARWAPRLPSTTTTTGRPWSARPPAAAGST